jgi:hypothetical protein
MPKFTQSGHPAVDPPFFGAKNLGVFFFLCHFRKTRQTRPVWGGFLNYDRFLGLG